MSARPGREGSQNTIRNLLGSLASLSARMALRLGALRLFCLLFLYRGQLVTRLGHCWRDLSKISTHRLAFSTVVSLQTLRRLSDAALPPPYSFETGRFVVINNIPRVRAYLAHNGLGLDFFDDEERAANYVERTLYPKMKEFLYSGEIPSTEFERDLLEEYSHHAAIAGTSYSGLILTVSMTNRFRYMLLSRMIFEKVGSPLLARPDPDLEIVFRNGVEGVKILAHDRIFRHGIADLFTHYLWLFAYIRAIMPIVEGAHIFLEYRQPNKEIDRRYSTDSELALQTHEITSTLLDSVGRPHSTPVMRRQMVDETILRVQEALNVPLGELETVKSYNDFNQNVQSLCDKMMGRSRLALAGRAVTQAEPADSTFTRLIEYVFRDSSLSGDVVSDFAGNTMRYGYEGAFLKIGLRGQAFVYSEPGLLVRRPSDRMYLAYDPGMMRLLGLPSMGALGSTSLEDLVCGSTVPTALHKLMLDMLCNMSNNGEFRRSPMGYSWMEETEEVIAQSSADARTRKEILEVIKKIGRRCAGIARLAPLSTPQQSALIGIANMSVKGFPEQILEEYLVGYTESIADLLASRPTWDAIVFMANYAHGVI